MEIFGIRRIDKWITQVGDYFEFARYTSLIFSTLFSCDGGLTKCRNDIVFVDHFKKILKGEIG